MPRRPPPARHPLNFTGGDSPRIVMLSEPRRVGNILHVHIGGWHSLADKEAMTAQGYSPRRTDLRLTDYQGTQAYMRFSNTFKMQLPTTNTRAVIRNGVYVLDDNSTVALDYETLPEGRTHKQEEYFDRDVTAEYEANCQAWVIRELSRMVRAGNAKYDVRGRQFGMRKADGTTLNLQVGASAGDAHETTAGSGFSATTNTMIMQSGVSSGYHGGAYFSSVGIPAGATVDSAVVGIYCLGPSADDPNLNAGFEDVDSAVDFSTDADVHTRVTGSMTAATVSWVSTGVAPSAAYVYSPELITPLQEVIDRPGWASGGGVCWLTDPILGSTKTFTGRTYDHDTTLAPKLDIDYTAAAAGGFNGLTLLGVG